MDNIQMFRKCSIGERPQLLKNCATKAWNNRGNLGRCTNMHGFFIEASSIFDSNRAIAYEYISGACTTARSMTKLPDFKTMAELVTAAVLYRELAVWDSVRFKTDESVRVSKTIIDFVTDRSMVILGNFYAAFAMRGNCFPSVVLRNLYIGKVKHDAAFAKGLILLAKLTRPELKYQGISITKHVFKDYLDMQTKGSLHQDEIVLELFHKYGLDLFKLSGV